MQLIKNILNYQITRLFKNAFISRARHQLRPIKPHRVVKVGNLSQYQIYRGGMLCRQS